MNFTVSVKQFLNLLSLLRRLNNEEAYIKSSPTMFSIIIFKPSLLVSLQIMPPFFTTYSCDQIHYIKFNIANIFINIFHHQNIGYPFLNFISFAPTRHHIALKYKNNRDGGLTRVVKEPTFVPNQQRNVLKIDYSSFASFEMKDFRRVVQKAYYFDVPYARVTIMHSRIRFLFGRHHEMIVLYKEGIREECIIGGVDEEDQIDYSIIVAPRQFFNNLTSKRVWLFKSFDSNHIILTAPMGLYTQILSYFPQN